MQCVWCYCSGFKVRGTQVGVLIAVGAMLQLAGILIACSSNPGISCSIQHRLQHLSLVCTASVWHCERCCSCVVYCMHTLFECRRGSCSCMELAVVKSWGCSLQSPGARCTETLEGVGRCGSMLLMYGCNIAWQLCCCVRLLSVSQAASKTCVQSAVLCDQALARWSGWTGSSQWATSGGAGCELWIAC